MNIPVLALEVVLRQVAVKVIDLIIRHATEWNERHGAADAGDVSQKL